MPLHPASWTRHWLHPFVGKQAYLCPCLSRTGGSTTFTIFLRVAVALSCGPSRLPLRFRSAASLQILLLCVLASTAIDGLQGHHGPFASDISRRRGSSKFGSPGLVDRGIREHRCSCPSGPVISSYESRQPDGRRLDSNTCRASHRYGTRFPSFFCRLSPPNTVPLFCALSCLC